METKANLMTNLTVPKILAGLNRNKQFAMEKYTFANAESLAIEKFETTTYELVPIKTEIIIPCFDFIIRLTEMGPGEFKVPITSRPVLFDYFEQLIYRHRIVNPDTSCLKFLPRGSKDRNTKILEFIIANNDSLKIFSTNT